MGQGTASPTPRDRNAWWKQWETDLGTELKMTVVDSTQYGAKFQTAIAGNVLGDLTQIDTVPQMPKVLEKMFTDLTPFLSGDNVKKYPNLASLPAASWDMCMIDGKIWGVTNSRIIAGSVLMTRGDILESKGIKTMPELSSGEDFLDMCKEVTDKSKGIFAIGQIPQNWTVPAIMEALGGPNGWKVENGTWTSAYESPEYERALEIVSQMWQGGLFHPNTYTDLSSTGVWFNAGATVLFAQSIASWQGRAASAPYPCGVVKMPKWEGGGIAPKHLGAPGYYAPVGLKKIDDEKRIDELLRMLDYIASPFGTEEYLKVNYGVRDRQYKLVDKQVVPDTEKVTAETVSGLVYAGGTSGANVYSPGKPEATKVVHGYMAEMIPGGVRNPSYGRFSDTNVSKGATANRKLNDLMGNIVQGRAKLSDWAAGVKEWKSEAGDEIAKEYAAQQ